VSKFKSSTTPEQTIGVHFNSKLGHLERNLITAEDFYREYPTPEAKAMVNDARMSRDLFIENNPNDAAVIKATGGEA
tara:strand:+ start:650 stop:880 length:231 start_codon:yes stop_codon:yes gene_type:complete